LAVEQIQRQAIRATATPVEEPPASATRIPAVAFQNIVGTSPVLRRAIELGCRVANSPSTTVLIQGDTGTGKELFARGIHYSSPNAPEPFVAINCSAIPEHLLESELFGHEKGAFSGADSLKKGLLEFAGNGTVFLDEIGDLPTNLQPKLLRVLEERQVRRVGGLRELEINCRIVAATHRDLQKSVEEGHFRADLFYRLSVFTIQLPPLRDRTGDVEVLARYYLDSICRDHGIKPKKFTPEALAALSNYSWPGNVRELKNAVEGAIIVSEGEWIRPEHVVVRRRTSVPTPMSETAPVAAVIRVPETGLTLENAERQLLEATLKLTKFNISRTARMLAVSRPTVLRKLEQFGIKKPQPHAT
jgi:two-component system, NtrC family, response regulator AtoC